MALSDLLAQLNVVNCGAANSGTTGTAGCPFDWSRIVTIELSNKNLRYSDAQDLAYIQEQQTLGNLIIITNFETFANVTPDANFSTAEGSGFKTLIGEMPYEYNGTISDGVVKWQGMRSLNGKDVWNVALYDSEGNKIMTKTKAGEVKGFGVKLFYVGVYKGAEGANQAMQAVTIQLADYKEVDRQVWITADGLDFDPTSDIDGINGVDLTMNPVVSGATTLTFTAKLQDRTHDVEGLLVSDFEVKKDGVVIVPSLLTYSEGVYTATVPAVASAEVYTVSLPNTFVSGVGYRSVLNGTVVVS